MRTQYDIQADEFLRAHRMCLHAELAEKQQCPPWVMFTMEFYAPSHPDCCDFCGHLHGDGYHVSLMRLDSEEMLEFDFWHSAACRGQRPDEYYLLAAISHWVSYEKDFMELCDKFPEIQHEEAQRLIDQSWEFFNFFYETERLALSTIH